MSLIKNLGEQVKIGNLKELTLTTNGSQLAKYADQLVDYGRSLLIDLHILPVDCHLLLKLTPLSFRFLPVHQGS